MTGRSTWTQAHVRRLFWRAGFGATPQQARLWARRGRRATLRFLLGSGSALRGPAPRVHGKALDPANEWGHDVLWWLDRMVRAQRPLEEKLTLFWHDHFATAGEDTPLMLAQNQTLRTHALGNFRTLLGAVTRDPAMQLFLSLADSDKYSPNENYAREVMELFALGGGYSEDDVREMARALTGFQAHWGDSFQGITYEEKRHDDGVKTIFGQRGRFDVDAALDLVVAHPRHAPFLVRKLWDYFISEPPSNATVRSLARIYRSSGYELRPVVSAILGHPALYRRLDAPAMVKSPVVYVAGLLRAAGRHVDVDDWTWLLQSMGQYPFDPPSVAGWEWGPAWLSTSSMRMRFMAVNYITERAPIKVPDKATAIRESPASHLSRARRAVGEPWVSRKTSTELTRMAGRMADVGKRDWLAQTNADMTQRVMRHFLLSGPDAQLH